MKNYVTVAVLRTKAEKKSGTLPCGCPGSEVRKTEGELSNWPVQIKLAPVRAPYFEEANLLVAADCTAYAYGNFHKEFMRNHVTLVGCPKLDAVNYTEKLTGILAENNVQSVTVIRMQVPCCGGMEMAVMRAMEYSGKTLPWRVVTISTDGRIVGEIRS